MPTMDPNTGELLEPTSDPLKAELERELEAGVDETLRALAAHDRGEDDVPIVPPEGDEPAGLEDDPGPTAVDPNDPDAEADQRAEEQRRRETSGKYVVLVHDTEDAPNLWALLIDGSASPRLYDGPRDEARKAALNDPAHADLAEAVRARPGEIEMVAVPASSWAPAPVRPRVVTTTWVIG